MLVYQDLLTGKIFSLFFNYNLFLSDWFIGFFSLSLYKILLIEFCLLLACTVARKIFDICFLGLVLFKRERMM
jgi:hypothetical protein